jgi:hypothetical protein
MATPTAPALDLDPLGDVADAEVVATMLRQLRKDRRTLENLMVANGHSETDPAPGYDSDTYGDIIGAKRLAEERLVEANKPLLPLVRDVLQAAKAQELARLRELSGVPGPAT